MILRSKNLDKLGKIEFPQLNVDNFNYVSDTNKNEISFFNENTANNINFNKHACYFKYIDDKMINYQEKNTTDSADDASNFIKNLHTFKNRNNEYI